MKGNGMKKGSTIFLRGVILLLAVAALFLATLILPAIYQGWEEAYPTFAYLRFPFLIGLAATMVPFFIALYQTLKLLDYIDKNTAFSEQSIQRLRYITYCAVAFSVLYVAMLPIVYIVADRVDAPGLMVIGFTMSFAPVVIAVFAAVLQKLLQSAIDMKSENDLTV